MNFVHTNIDLLISDELVGRWAMCTHYDCIFDMTVFFNYCSLCLNFFHLLAKKPNEEKKKKSNKFFHSFDLSEYSFTCQVS